MRIIINSWSDMNKSFFSALKVERNVMFIILTLILMVAAFNIISGMTIFVKNKTKEIAVLKTLGASPFNHNESIFYYWFIYWFYRYNYWNILGLYFALILIK